MPQIPMFTPWFELLKIVSFGTHYVQTFIDSGNSEFLRNFCIFRK